MAYPTLNLVLLTLLQSDLILHTNFYIFEEEWKGFKQIYQVATQYECFDGIHGAR